MEEVVLYNNYLTSSGREGGRDVQVSPELYGPGLQRSGGGGGGGGARRV